MLPEPSKPASQSFHVMAKAIGPICNLDCKYCFYLEKEQLYPNNEKWKMSDERLEAFVRDYIAAQPGPEVSFAFQGGEPTLLGVDYFRKVIAFQKSTPLAKPSVPLFKLTALSSMIHGANS